MDSELFKKITDALRDEENATISVNKGNHSIFVSAEDMFVEIWIESGSVSLYTGPLGVDYFPDDSQRQDLAFLALTHYNRLKNE
jgi:hypothetical protein